MYAQVHIVVLSNCAFLNVGATKPVLMAYRHACDSGISFCRCRCVYRVDVGTSKRLYLALSLTVVNIS